MCMYWIAPLGVSIGKFQTRFFIYCQWTISELKRSLSNNVVCFHLCLVFCCLSPCRSQLQQDVWGFPWRAYDGFGPGTSDCQLSPLWPDSKGRTTPCGARFSVPHVSLPLRVLVCFTRVLHISLRVSRMTRSFNMQALVRFPKVDS